MKKVIRAWLRRIVCSELTRQQVEALRKAADLYREASYSGHSSHWDPTGRGGAGCKACQRANETRSKADDMLARHDVKL